MPQTHYGVLGIQRDATPGEIKRTYRRLARRYHPDVVGSSPASEARFQRINEAWQVLGDPEGRGAYDYELSLPSQKHWERQQPAPSSSRPHVYDRPASPRTRRGPAEYQYWAPEWQTPPPPPAPRPEPGPLTWRDLWSVEAFVLLLNAIPIALTLVLILSPLLVSWLVQSLVRWVWTRQMPVSAREFRDILQKCREIIADHLKRPRDGSPEVDEKAPPKRWWRKTAGG